MKHFVKTPSCRSCLPTFDPSRPKTVPEEMKLGEDDSGEAQSRISPEQLVCQQISSSSQVRLSFSNVNIDVVHTRFFCLFKSGDPSMDPKPSLT